VSSTVQMGSMTVTSTGESAQDMVKALQPPEESKDTPKILVDGGEVVEDKPKDEVSEAASTLGKKGGKAAAKARAAAKEEEPEPEKEPEKPQEKKEPARAKAEDEDDLSDLPEDGRARTRVQNAIRAKKAAEERLNWERTERTRLAQEVERLRASSAPRQAPQEAPKAQAGPDEEPEPKADDFESYEAYVKAAGSHAARQEFKRLQTEHAEVRKLEAEDQAVFTLYGAHKQVMDSALKEDPELLNRIDPRLLAVPPSFNMPPGKKAGPVNFLRDEVMVSRMAPALYEHFTEHPEDWQRIAALSNPRLIVREVARLEYRLEDATAGNPPSKREVSQAPNPPRPVRAAPHTEAGEPDENAPVSAFVRSQAQRLSRTR
jgi:hypothetical protein